MKGCERFEKMLPGYLHGELYEKEYHALKAHLEGCASCRAELEALNQTMQLAEHVMAVIPTPSRMSGWRRLPRQKIDLRTNGFARILFSPQFKAALASVIIAGGMFFVSGLFVVFSVVQAPSAEFSPPPPLERPKLKLKKPKLKVQKNAHPKPSSRIVAKVQMAQMPDMQMPSMAGTGEGLLGGVGGGSEFVELPEISTMSAYGLAASPEPEPAAKPAPAAVVARDYYDDPFAADTDQLQAYGAPMPEPTDSRIPLSRPARSAENLNGFMAMDGDAGSDAPDEESEGMDDLFGGDAVFGESTLDFGFADVEDRKDDLLSNREKRTEGGSYDESRQLSESMSDKKPNDQQEENRPRLIAEQKEGIERNNRMDSASAMTVSGVSERSSGDSYAMHAAPPRKRKPAVYNPYILAAENAFSTFAIDVDTASYGLARQQLLAGALPETEAVRTEEFINSFDYDYRPPTGKQTFAIHAEMAPSPFRSRMELLKVGIKGRRIGRDDHRGAILTLVIDTSGSMSTPERLGLVKQSLALLLNQLAPEDEVAIVQFGGQARLVLEHTPVSEKAEILAAIEGLQPGGPTQFDKGLELGYQVATDGFRSGDSNRIITMSDGVANLGELDPDAILGQVAEYRDRGIYLSVFGFGAGAYDDELLERLANRGDGMYAYIDTIDEARQLFVDRLAATLHVIASDVKIQIEFNPDRVLRYRQLGYENRQLTKEQFRDDTVDAGEVGSGQSVTALYDVELKPDGLARDPIATTYVRYRRTDNGTIEEISSRVMDSVRNARFEDADVRFQLAACVAEFAERLRRSPYAEGTELQDILGRLQPVVLALDLDGQVRELQQLISIAAGLVN